MITKVVLALQSIRLFVCVCRWDETMILGVVSCISDGVIC